MKNERVGKKGNIKLMSEIMTTKKQQPEKLTIENWATRNSAMKNGKV